MSDNTKSQVRAVADAKVAQDSTSPEDNVDKIREILFGGQAREYDRRLHALAARLEEDTHRLKSEVNERMGKFENFIQKEFERLHAGIEKERTERSEATERLEQALSASSRNFTDKLSRLEDRSTRESSDLHRQIHDQSADLLKRISELQELTRAGLEKEAERLQATKLGRGDFADLLMEMAMRLNTPFELPTK